MLESREEISDRDRIRNEFEKLVSRLLIKDFKEDEELKKTIE
jgi:hypothetical protein